MSAKAYFTNAKASTNVNVSDNICVYCQFVVTKQLTCQTGSVPSAGLRAVPDAGAHSLQATEQNNINLIQQTHLLCP